MFQHSTFQMGEYHIDVFQDDKGNSLSIAPSRGATILQIEVLGTPILDGYTSAAELHAYDWYKNAVLLPYPNRLRDGKYIYANQNYQWPINEMANHNQLHGFGVDSIFKLSHFEAESSDFTCTYQFDYTGDKAYFPFPFRFDMQIKMNQYGNVSMQMSTQNTGNQTMPFGCGWHPYFKIADVVDKVTLRSPSLSQICIDERMLPNGETVDFDTFLKDKSLLGISLDNCFHVKTTDSQTTIELTSAKGQLSYWQDANCPYIQLFTLFDRQSVAIEPMTCNIDAFNNGEGLWELGPDEQRAMTFGFGYTAKKSFAN